MPQYNEYLFLTTHTSGVASGLYAFASGDGSSFIIPSGSGTTPLTNLSSGQITFDDVNNRLYLASGTTFVYLQFT